MSALADIYGVFHLCQESGIRAAQQVLARVDTVTQTSTLRGITG